MEYKKPLPKQIKERLSISFFIHLEIEGKSSNKNMIWLNILYF